MPKITFMGAGSTVFAKNILGDCMLVDSLRDSHFALYDIDGVRLRESKRMLETLNANINQGRAKISAHLGTANRAKALSRADYVVNAIQVGGYEPATVIDFEVPKKFGLRQTIGDTLGIGGIFRALRTIPVMMDFARDMETVCPEALLLNYSNPMAMLTGAMIRGTGIKTVGLCHSVEPCARILVRKTIGSEAVKEHLVWNIAGINHQAWLLDIRDGKRDLYPAIKKEARRLMNLVWRKGPAAFIEEQRSRLGDDAKKVAAVQVADDLVRLQVMLDFEYYITESSEHNAEYMPYFIKERYPELIERYNIPLDEYPRRCIKQIEEWKARSKELTKNPHLDHVRTEEYGSRIMDAMETNVPIRIGGNVLNNGCITNLPAHACVEIPCLVDANGVRGCRVGDLPEQCAALNRTNINPQLLTIEAALTGKKDRIYQAAMLDPHTAAELPIDTIKKMCDALIEAHGEYLPSYR